MAAIDNVFAFPEGSRGSALWRLQHLLYKQPDGLELVPFFLHLNLYVRDGSEAASDIWPELPALSPLQRLRRAAGRDRSRMRHHRADILVLGGTMRLTEQQAIWRAVEAWVQQGWSVLYLAQAQAEVTALRESLPEAVLQRVEVELSHHWIARLPGLQLHEDARELLAHYRARVEPLLRDADVGYDGDARESIERIVFQTAAWRRMRPWLTFRCLFYQPHGLPLGLAAAIGELQADRPVVTFQHGVVSHTAFAPIMAHCKLTFGEPSAQFIRQWDHQLAALCDKPVTCERYLPAGSIYDRIEAPHPCFEAHTLLVIDQGTHFGKRFYAMETAEAALFEVVEALVRDASTLQRVIVRLHPASVSYERWHALVSRYPLRMEISHPQNSLDFDARRSAFCLGLFSGALVSTLAMGTPTFFLYEPGWYYTGDLGSFREHFFVSRAELKEVAQRLLTEPAFHAEQSARSREQALHFYAGGKDFPAEDTAVEALRPYLST